MWVCATHTNPRAAIAMVIHLWNEGWGQVATSFFTVQMAVGEERGHFKRPNSLIWCSGQ